ncbi:hypothetical protein OF83DRAFT_1180736, partial [Amylostereum chailletii]
DESDGIASPPLTDGYPIAVSDLSLAFLPFAGSAPYRAPEHDHHQYHTYEDEKRRRREREQKGHRGDDPSRHRRAVGVRDVERQTGDLTLDDELEEDDPEEDDLVPAAGRYKSFGERSALSGFGFDGLDDGCLGAPPRACRATLNKNQPSDLHRIAVAIANSRHRAISMDIEQFRKAGYQAIDRICDYYYSLREKPVSAQVEPGYLRKALPGKCASNPEHHL